MRIAHIYVLIDPETKMARYVGKAVNPQKRLRQHIYNSNREVGHKWNWILSLKRKSLNPIMEIVEVHPESEISEWCDAERFWISYLRSIGCRLTNLDSGGSEGKIVSEETKHKLRAANEGRIYKPEWIEKLKEGKRNGKVPVLTPEGRAKRIKALTGAVFSEERKKKISLSKIGKKRDAAVVEKIRIAQIGRVTSEETKKKLSAAGKGRVASAKALENMRAAQRARTTIKIGDVFGRLTVQERSPWDCNKWICLCSCGNKSSPTGARLRAGGSKSCGCGIPKFTKGWVKNAMTKGAATRKEQAALFHGVSASSSSQE